MSFSRSASELSGVSDIEDIQDLLDVLERTSSSLELECSASAPSDLVREFYEIKKRHNDVSEECSSSESQDMTPIPRRSRKPKSLPKVCSATRKALAKAVKAASKKVRKST